MFTHVVSHSSRPISRARARGHAFFEPLDFDIRNKRIPEGRRVGGQGDFLLHRDFGSRLTAHGNGEGRVLVLGALGSPRGYCLRVRQLATLTRPHLQAPMRDSRRLLDARSLARAVKLKDVAPAVLGVCC